MALVVGGKRGFLVLALIMGVGLTGPLWAEDWRKLRPIDLPAELVSATWGEGAYLSEGHPIQFGRMAVKMQPNDVARTIIVKATTNALDGIVIDNLTCYNALSGERMCALLLDRPNWCHLFVYLRPKSPDSENYDVECPADLKLGD
jgi:hypothetical protein